MMMSFKFRKISDGNSGAIEYDNRQKEQKGKCDCDCTGTNGEGREEDFSESE